ncbi:MAG: Mor transcription activator family protein [Gallionellaceae bacterium]
MADNATPVNLLEIIEIIGETHALKLVKRYGGTTPRLPAIRNIKVDHHMAQCIGVEALTKLAKTTGGGRWLYIPRCARGLREARNREIVQLYTDGMKVDDLALKFGLSDRQIENILGSAVIDDRQPSLF